MRNNEAGAEPSIACFSARAGDKPAPWGMIPSGAGTIQRCLRSWLVVLLRLAHDFLGREVNAASREGVADEKVIAFLEVRVFGSGQRQLHRLRHDLTFQSGDRSLDRDCDLSRAGSTGGALEALGAVRGTELAEAVLGLASDRHERMAGIHQGADGARGSALH